jgi:hypothetical protein
VHWGGGGGEGTSMSPFFIVRDREELEGGVSFGPPFGWWGVYVV